MMTNPQELCNYLISGTSPCARPKRHAGSHRSSVALEKNRQRMRDQYHRDPAIRARQKLSAKKHTRGAHGLKPHEARELKDGKPCGICGTIDPNSARMHVDHDHTTGKIRGVLCHNCNRGLGMFKDSPELLRAATKYVSRRRR